MPAAASEPTRSRDGVLICSRNCGAPAAAECATLNMQFTQVCRVRALFNLMETSCGGFVSRDVQVIGTLAVANHRQHSKVENGMPMQAVELLICGRDISEPYALG
jgi:hypothetical protein